MNFSSIARRKELPYWCYTKKVDTKKAKKIKNAVSASGSCTGVQGEALRKSRQKIKHD